MISRRWTAAAGVAGALALLSASPVLVARTASLPLPSPATATARTAAVPAVHTAVQVPDASAAQGAAVHILPVAPSSTTPAVTRHRVSGVHRAFTHAAVVPAPAAFSAANVLRVDPLATCVSCTRAAAGPDGSTAEARAIRVLGVDVVGGVSSVTGTHSTDGNHGALVAVPANPVIALAIADWVTMSRVNPDGSNAFSRSALVDLSLADGQVATLAIFQAVSNASWTGTASHGDAATDGAVLNLFKGAVVVVLLHSDTSSDHLGKAYIVSVNGNEFFTAAQTNPVVIELPGVLKITLLQVLSSGGSGSAVVGTVDNLLGMANAAGVLTTSAGSTAATAPTTGVTPPSTGVQAAAQAAAAGASGAAHPRVPSTGIELGAAGILIALTGLITLLLTLRRPRRSMSSAR